MSVAPLNPKTRPSKCEHKTRSINSPRTLAVLSFSSSVFLLQTLNLDHRSAFSSASSFDASSLCFCRYSYGFLFSSSRMPGIGAPFPFLSRSRMCFYFSRRRFPRRRLFRLLRNPDAQSTLSSCSSADLSRLELSSVFLCDSLFYHPSSFPLLSLFVISHLLSLYASSCSLSFHPQAFLWRRWCVSVSSTMR
jgi:hypothetical protein